MNTSMRLTGLATGMDTDTAVKQMMRPYQIRVDRMRQDKEMVQWRQDLYREIISDISSFRSTYFDKTKPENYILTKNAYTGFDIKINKYGTTEPLNGLSVEGITGAFVGNYKVDFTNGHLAKEASITSNDRIVTTGGKRAATDTKLSSLGISAETIKITYNNSGEIEEKELNITPEMTLNGLANAITAATSSNVIARYSELTSNFTLSTSASGQLRTVELNASPELLEILKLGDGTTNSVNQGTANYGTSGQDLFVKITGPDNKESGVLRESNRFTIDGVVYTMKNDKNADGSPLVADIEIKKNIEEPFKKIKGFIDKFNEIVEKVNKKIDEKKQYSYKPLTEEQKKDMSEEDIKKWEAKAKEGLLKGDSSLQSMLISLRNAFFEGVEGAGISINEIGFNTSSVYSNRGKIMIDEAKFKQALQDRGEQLANIFAKVANNSIEYDPTLTSQQRAERTKTEGIFQRINDILLDYTRTTRDSDGRKGLLIEKAGIKGETSEFLNLLSDDMSKRDKRINDLIRVMASTENKYYMQFAKLEKAMNSLNSQSNWLMQQFSSGR